MLGQLQRLPVIAVTVAVAVLAGCDPIADAPPSAVPRADARRTSLPPIVPPRVGSVAPAFADDAELAEILADDAHDHRTIPSGSDLDARDAQRRARVVAIVAEGRARSAADYLAVATVLDHGALLEDFADARRYAVVAAKLGDRRGVRLAAQAWDRWLVRAGLPQRFGTLARCDDDGCRLHVYEPATTDEERAAWDVPPLRALKGAAERARRLP